MRLDAFLANSGRIPRRTQAKAACEQGLVEVDGKTAKPSTPVQVGQEVTLRTGMSVRKYRILQLPQRPVARTQRDEYSELLSSVPVSRNTDF